MIELSIVIPTYNRAERLRACLDVLGRQTQPADDFEVIVVVDGSNDGTNEMLKSLETPFSLKFLFQENQGQNVARNYGVEHARGRYCLFLDDDIMAEPELVSEHLNLHRQRKKVVGIGQMSLKIPEPSDWFTFSFAKGWHQHYDELNRGLRAPTWLDCYGGNMSVARSTFLEVGGFAADIRRSHDIELGFRLEQSGLEFTYLPQAIGWQDERKGIIDLAEDARKSGAAWVKLCERHPEMYPHLLGPVLNVSLRESLLREFLWRSGVSPRILASIGRMLSDLHGNWKWYRFIFTYFYWCGVQKTMPNHNTKKHLKPGTLILMYHAFAATSEAASRFILPIDRFASQMKWLKRLGYCVITLDEFLQLRRKHLLPPARSIVLTIDDGYTDIYTLVFPVLQHYDFPATVFLVSRKIGACNDWASYRELRGRQLLTWEKIRELQCANIQFGAHTRTHARLTSMTPEQAQEEIAGSRTDLENVLGPSIYAFAYPFGEYNPQVEVIVEQAGFLGGCTAESGVNTPETSPTALHRIEVEGTWSIPRFLLTLWLGKDIFS